MIEENAKANTINGNITYSHIGEVLENILLISMISLLLLSVYDPVNTITIPVINDTITVSMNGSSIAIHPTLTGSVSCVDECIIGEVPIPASFAKTDLLTPAIKEPATPPAMLFPYIML
ncbi:KH-domain/beta-lactamase-domain protein [Ehrlichia ruminantium]|uniref:KH-domain/beta-lactamase-domain protein n=1 Tax=Ehrlichia ruminantium TaxID=779 RepID=A0A161M3M2_EHRRU|nr:KH-domain/beta-lactamase-domain protein [Ehrlichia ruminantium]GAT77150.1 KH-domain/beta-lactamase-domain protein [Ehrlichia ruminantium]GAT78229.1 KH-domain/beta-lactamase-domain protein [Ehrlichia ruminantium]